MGLWHQSFHIANIGYYSHNFIAGFWSKLSYLGDAQWNTVKPINPLKESGKAWGSGKVCVSGYSGLVFWNAEAAVLGTESKEAMFLCPGGTRIWLCTGSSPVCLSPPAPLCLYFPWHLLMIKVPAVYNYQFDKFRSSLLIIIISFPLSEASGV